MNKITKNNENIIVDEGFTYFYNLYASAINNLEHMQIYGIEELKKLRDNEAKREKVEKVLAKIKLNNSEYVFDPQKFDILMFVAKRLRVEQFTKEEFEDISKSILKKWYDKHFKAGVDRYLNYKNFLGDKRYTRNERIGLSNLKNAIIGRYGCVVLTKSPIGIKE